MSTRLGRCLTDQAPLQMRLRPEHHSTRLPHHGHLEVHRTVLQVGRHSRATKIGLRHRLQPHRLPNPRRPRVVTAVRGIQPALLARGLNEAARVVLSAYRDHVVARLQEIGNVKGERRVSASVLSHRLAVHPHLRLVVHRPEVQQHPLRLPLLRQAELAPVPHRRNEVLVTDPRQLALGTERHQDAAPQLLRRGQAPLPPAHPEVHLKLPLAVQVQPLFAHHLRTRVLRARLGHPPRPPVC